MSLEEAYRALYSFALLVIAVLLLVMLIRVIRGPGVTDRLLSINMISTLVNVAIIILAALLQESFLLDVALVYTMISLVSMLIMARVYLPAEPHRKAFPEKGKER